MNMPKPALLALTGIAAGLGAVATALPAPWSAVAAAVVAALSLLTKAR